MGAEDFHEFLKHRHVPTVKKMISFRRAFHAISGWIVLCELLYSTSIIFELI